MKINGNFGYFETTKNEYVIKNMFPLRPLKNYLFNESFILDVDQFGFGTSKGKTDCGFRDLINGERLIYIKENNNFYSANRNYSKLPFNKFECHVGINYQKIISSYKGIECQFLITLPELKNSEINQIKLKNHRKSKATFSLYFVNKPHVNLTYHDAYSYSYFNKENNGIIFSHKGYDVEEKNAYIGVFSDAEVEGYDTSEQTFLGYYNSFEKPIGLINEKLSNIPFGFDGYQLAVLEYKIELLPNEEKVINILSLFRESEEQLIDSKNEFFNYKNQLVNNDISSENNKILIKSSNNYLDVMINTWLKRQISLGKTWGRVYGKGFRDIMQDVSSFLPLDTAKAKMVILDTLKYQFYSGNTIRQFDPIYDYPYQDGASWIPSTLLNYLKETNDFSILNIKVKYYDNEKEETVIEHALKGIDYLLNNTGKHGLVLWGGGDWNDSLNNCGTKGIGESVWLSMAVVKATKELIEILNKVNLLESNLILNKKVSALEEAIIKYGFEDDQYIYGYNDLGTKVGSKYSTEGKIYLNPQTWSILANINTLEVQNLVMDKVEKELQCDFGYMQVFPSLRTKDENIGRASYFVPGTYENGSVYNHGVAFKIASDLKIGRYDKAYESLLKILPYYNHSSGMEDYAIGNMYFGIESPSRVGFAPISWITGTAGWLFKIIIEEMIGIKPDYNGIVLDPKLPSALNLVEIKREYQGKIFNIKIERKNLDSPLIYINDKREFDNKIEISKYKTKRINVLYQY